MIVVGRRVFRVVRNPCVLMMARVVLVAAQVRNAIVVLRETVKSMFAVTEG